MVAEKQEDLGLAEEAGPEVVYVEDLAEENDARSKGRGKVAPAKPQYDETFLTECRKYIDQEFIDGGGDLREDQKGTRYWLDLPDLLEFEKADAEIESDREFWAWFKAFRERRGIGKLEKKRPRWTDYDSGYSSTPKRDYMHGWWKGWGYDAQTELAGRLAIAVGAVQSIVNVVNDTGRPFRVRLASDDSRQAPASMTVFDEQCVVVSPQALLDTSLDETLRIDITAGWGLHEGSHVRDTWPVIDALRQPTPLTPLLVAGSVHNIVEDTRIEANTATIFPGFAEYLEKASDYVWDVTKQHVPKTWGPELSDKINAITAIVKWSRQFEPVVHASSDAQLKAEFAWFSAWAERYRTILAAVPEADRKRATRSLVIEALNHLREDDETAQQMDQQAAEEQESHPHPDGLTDEGFRDLIERLKAQKGVLEPCPTPLRGKGKRQPIMLTQDQARQVKELIEEEFEKRDPIVRPDDKATLVPNVVSRRPQETAHSKRAYRRPTTLVGRLRSAFVFRKVAPEYTQRILRSGMLDEDNLWRIAGNDFQVFERKVTTTTPDTQITMLVDMSGSMAGERIETAQELANVMLECLRTMRGVKVRVRGHTTTRSAEPIVYRLWEPGDPMTRLGLIAALDHRWNYDGFAIDWCAQELVRDARIDEDKVIIVLSDGKPNGSSSDYGGIPAMNHVRKVTDTWATRGVTTIQIAIDPEMRSHDQARMFRNWIQFETREKLPFQLTKLLSKLFGEVSQ